MKITDYLTPVDKKSLKIDIQYSIDKETFYHIDTYSDDKPKLKNYDIAILGVEEERNTHNKGTQLAPYYVRKELYKLINNTKLKIIDLGNIRIGKSLNDTYVALSDVIYELVDNQVVPIVIGGGQDLTYGIYSGIKKFNKLLNLVSIDSKIDLGNEENDFDSESYLGQIILKNRENLFNYVNLGHQSYYCKSEELKLLYKMRYEAYRLGLIRANIAEFEPIMRDANMVSLDISSIRQSDAPAHTNPSPNGFYSEEICQLARYAGISDTVQCLGLFELNPQFDVKNQTSVLAAQIIWYFIDGITDRENDYPSDSDKRYTKYIVNIGKTDQNMIFYQNNSNKRWWLQVPNPKNTQKSVVIACKHSDYVLATKQELPEKWLNTVHKML